MSLFSSSSEPVTFPETRGARLDGTELTLPDDLPAPLTLVIVGFRDHLDPIADQWARLGNRMAEGREDLAILETPVVSRGFSLLGDLATVGIRGQVESDEERERTVPIYVDKAAFRKHLGLKKEADVYPLLVRREDGRVLWMGNGAIDMEEISELEAALAAEPPAS